MNELKNAIKKEMSKNKENKDRADFITEADLAEIEASLQGKNPLIKGSRFTNAQDLQFTSVCAAYFLRNYLFYF